MANSFALNLIQLGSLSTCENPQTHPSLDIHSYSTPRHILHPPAMSDTLAQVEALVSRIADLTKRLPSSIPEVTRDDCIYTIMTTVNGDSMWETFNRWFDILFDENVRDENGPTASYSAREAGDEKNKCIPHDNPRRKPAGRFSCPHDSQARVDKPGVRDIMVRFSKFNIQDSQLTFSCSGTIGDSRNTGVEDAVVREANAPAALRLGDELGPDNRCDIARAINDVTGSSDLMRTAQTTSVGQPPILLGRGHLHTYLHGQIGEPVFPILLAPVTSPTPSLAAILPGDERTDKTYRPPAQPQQVSVSIINSFQLDQDGLEILLDGERVELKKVSIPVVWTRETADLPYKRQRKSQGAADIFLVTDMDAGDSADGLLRGQGKRKRGRVLGKKTKK